MSDMNRDYFRKKDSKILLNAPRCEIYVPDRYVKSKLADPTGELYDLFFVLKYRIFHDDNSARSKVPVRDFFFPTMVLTKPDEIEDETLDLYGEEEKFKVFVYHRGGEIVYNTNIVKTSNMVERYITLLNDGKIIAPYGMINELTNRVQKIHDVKLNVPQYIQQMTISEVYRNKKDLSEPVRLSISANDKKTTSYETLNMRENSAFTSTLAGVGFEDIKSMLTVSDNRDDRDNKDIGSIEKIIRGVK